MYIFNNVRSGVKFSFLSRYSVKIWFILLSLFILANCAGKKVEDRPQYPMNPEDARKLRNGRLTGEGGFSLFGGDDSREKEASSPIGVNSFLWRASLDTLSFMPLASADPFGGVILTDWYEDPNATGERFKVTALILGRALRTDGIKVTVFKQKRDETGTWRDEPVNAEVGRKLEDTILTQARELRVKSGN
jgi:hypothetical protein